MRVPDPIALAAVACAEARFAERQERGRLRLLRLRLQATVVAVSPLTRDLVAGQGHGLDAAACLFRPALSLAPNRQRLHSSRARVFSSYKGLAGARTRTLVRPSDLRVSRSVSREGVVLPQDDEGGDGLGLVAIDGVLECTGWLGTSWIATERSYAHLIVASAIPETLVAAMPGRPVGGIFDHPALRDRDYRVTRLRALPDDGGWAVTFCIGLVGHEMPWRDLLAQEMGHGS